jgi:PAS domain S-box-containing protein
MDMQGVDLVECASAAVAESGTTNESESWRGSALPPEQAEARLRAVFDALASPLLVVDLSGQIVDANAAGRDYLGVGQDQALPSMDEYLASHRMFTLDGAEILAEDRPLARSLSGEIAHNREVRIVDPDGSEMWVLASGAPVRSRDGSIIGGLLTVNDVTERHRARKRLEEAYREVDAQRRILELVFDNIPHTHVAFFDSSFALVRINPDGPKLLGYDTVEEFTEALTHPDQWQVHLADGTPVPLDQWPLARALRGERFDSQEYFVVNPAGREVRFLMNGAPVAWNPDGTVALAVNVGHDVRELRRLVEAEREKSERLASAFAETHHRVKNNLQVIAALLDMRVMEGDEGEPVSRNDLRELTAQVRAIAAVHDFLSHTDPAMSVNGRAALERLVPMTSQTAGIPVTWEADNVVFSVKQGTALALLLNELVTNSGKHGATCCHVRLSVHEDHCELVTEDDGPGFPTGFDCTRDGNQGLALVCTLAERDLQGGIEFGRSERGGASVRIAFDCFASVSA